MLATLLALPPLLVAALLLWANTEGGRAALARLASGAVEGLSVEGLEGPLPGRLGIARIALADAQGVWLEAEDLRLAWDPRALLRREVHVEALAAGRIALHRLPAGDAAPPDPGPPGPLLPDLPRLPVALRIDRVEAARIELDEAVAGAPAILRATGSARLDDGGLTAALDAATEAGGTTLALDAALRPGTGRLGARVALRGAAGGPVSRLAGLGERPVALDLALDGPAEGATLALRAEAGPGLSAALQGTVRAPALDRLGGALAGRVDASGLLGTPLAGPIDLAVEAGRVADGRIALDRFEASGAAGRIEASGRLDPAGGRSALRAVAAASGSEAFAGLLPPGLLAWEAAQATAELTGRLDAPRVALDLALSGFGSARPALAALLGPAPRLRLVAQAPDRIETLTLAGSAVQAEASGRIGETLDLGFAAELAAPEGAVPGLAGALRLSGTARGPLADPTLAIEAATPRLEAAGRVVEDLSLAARIADPASAPTLAARAGGRLAGLPLSLDLRGRPGEQGWLVLEAAEAALGPLRLSAAGRLQPESLRAEGRLALEAAELGPLSPLLGQRVAGSLRLSAEGSLREGQQALSARLDVPRLEAAGIAARAVTARAEGTLDALDLALSGQANDIEAEARGRLATAQDGARRLDLAALRVAGFGEQLRLAAPARVTRRADGGFEIPGATLALGRAGTLRLEGSWGPEAADLRARLAGLDLASFAALAPDLAPAGIVAGEARVSGRVAAPEASATLRATGLRAAAPWARGLPAGEARIEARRAPDGALTATAEARLGAAARLAATARLPRGPGAEAPLEGTLDGTLDLGALSQPLLAAGADRVTGRLALALRAGGTVGAPVPGGEARLTGGSYRNPLQGVVLTDLSGTLRAEGARLRADLSARTPGEGRLALAGTLDPFGRFLPVDLALTATAAQPVASDLLRAVLDAELRLSGLLGNGATLSGPVRVRRADIRVPDRLPASVRTLGPVTERGTPPGRAPRPAPRAAAPRPAEAPPPQGAPIALAVTVEAPRAVFVRGRGLDAELGGSLAIGGRLDAPEIVGELEMRRGELAVIGRRLAFERGRLTFDGGLLPELAFAAASTSGSYTARVEVTGPPTRPEIAFTSSPELPPDEVVARLLFDRPLRELSPFELAQIAQAIAGATGLAGGGAAGILDRLRQGLGLDRLAVGGGGEGNGRATGTPEERSGPTVEAGRYVADGVYVGVRQGSETGSTRAQVRVDLTPRLRLEAETGSREAGERVGVNWEWQWGR